MQDLRSDASGVHLPFFKISVVGCCWCDALNHTEVGIEHRNPETDRNAKQYLKAGSLKSGSNKRCGRPFWLKA